MKITKFLLVAFVAGGLFIGLRAAFAGNGKETSTQPDSRHPELEYFKAINSAGPPQDPQLLFLLMAQYSNLNLQGEGA